jgi:hypothetical protein
VIDHHGQVPLALANRDLVDPEASETGEQVELGLRFGGDSA